MDTKRRNRIIRRTRKGGMTAITISISGIIVSAAVAGITGLAAYLARPSLDDSQ